MKTSWYVARNSNDTQGLVISEDTGENIAVTFKAENAAVIAAAPELLAALEELYRVLREDEGYMTYNPKMTQARAAINKARGQS